MVKAAETPHEQTYAEYAYTTNGKRWMISDANQNLTELLYDEHDRLDEMHFPVEITASRRSSATDRELYEYDGNDSRIKLTRRDGAIITYDYNKLNLLQRKAFQGRSDLAGHAREVHYAYDLRGNVEKALFDSVSGEGLVQSMDALGHMDHSTITLGGVNRKLGYKYNAKLRTKVTHPDNEAFTYDHDDLDRIESITHATAGPLAGFTYVAKGFPNVWTGGATTKFDFDDIGQLEKLEQHFLDPAYDNVYGYTRNPASQLTHLTTTNANFAPVTTPRSETYEVNGLNQSLTVSGVTQTHDKNGNLTNDGETKYVYDYENRLVKASTTADVLKAELWYDPLGRLHKVQGPSGTTTFLYDGDELVAEYDSTNKVTQRYVHGLGVDDPVVWFEGPAVNAHSRRHLQPNHQGSIVAISDTAGRKLNILRYDSWGKPQGTHSLRFGYTGQAWLPELGLWHYKARIYSPKLGRFLQTDPVGYEDQLNMYAYVGNDPWNMTDPTGMILDVFADIAFIAYDIYELVTSPSWTNTVALGADVVGAVIPVATGLGAGVRAAAKAGEATVDLAKLAGKGSDVATAAKGADKAASAAKGTREGIYEFPDQMSPGKDYVGQAKDMDARLKTHERSGRLNPGTEIRTNVPGGKTTREVAEHKRIQEKTGGVPARKSDAVSNQRDPIGPGRRKLLDP